MPTDGAPGEAWEILLDRALGLIDSASTVSSRPFHWSLGGGTVLMMRLNHRRSKDIDIFLTDPQLLGMFNPRISDAASGVTLDYDEGAQFVKLFLPWGEIDFVIARPAGDRARAATRLALPTATGSSPPSSAAYPTARSKASAESPSRYL